MNRADARPFFRVIHILADLVVSICMYVAIHKFTDLVAYCKVVICLQNSHFPWPFMEESADRKKRSQDGSKAIGHGESVSAPKQMDRSEKLGMKLWNYGVCRLVLRKYYIKYSLIFNVYYMLCVLCLCKFRKNMCNYPFWDTCCS